MELLKIGQYVEMVLSYLRLDSDSTDYVLREYPLDDILRQAVRKFAKMFILKKITLDFQETGKTVLTDEKWLLFVVEQVLSNALKYTREGSITITMEHPKTLVIRDTGIGIAPEHQARVFERFYRVDKARSRESGGTGLGLSIVKHAAQYHGAKLELKSDPGRGTAIAVNFTVPV